MEGYVRKRGEKWYYSFEASSVDGKRKRIEKVGGRTKKEAEAALRLALTEYNNAGLHFEPNQISVADYFDYWMKNYVEMNLGYNTKKSYEIMIDNHIKPAIGIYKLKALTPAVLQQLINDKYLIGFAKSHLTNLMSILSGAIKYAVHPCKFIKDNPMQYVKYPRYEHSKKELDQKIITNDEFNQIIERFPFGSAFYIPLMIGYHTGFRIGEALGLTWNDVDFTAETITLEHQLHRRALVKGQPCWYFGTLKTPSSYRTIKIGKTLLDILKKQKKAQMENRLKYGNQYTVQYENLETDSTNPGKKLRRIHSLQASLDYGVMNPVNLICTKENGEMVTHDTFRYASKVIHFSLGILFNFHSLRHTHATTLIENGANIKDVQARLGHANIETTLGTYTHATEKMASQSVEIFENAINHN